MNIYNVIKRPLLTEKGARAKENGENKYIFEVNKIATKSDIKHAIEKLFNVKVGKVSTMNLKGKARRVGVHSGRKSDWKKAYITLKEGQKIESLEV